MMMHVMWELIFTLGILPTQRPTCQILKLQRQRGRILKLEAIVRLCLKHRGLDLKV